ncbi:MAG: hypothetical protein LBJ67_13690 [Planctomycetaceae bacterium]|jgi:hypothetical protein|nr:hypothetical protein [Planctomycetaceae bacterium]
MKQTQNFMSNDSLLFFIAGIMQGSFREMALHDQSYRAELRRLLIEYFPDCRVYDPRTNHVNSIAYDEKKGRETFFMHNKMCGSEVDVLIAFVPEASMGTAIEMWEAYQAGAVVITISPLAVNWAIRFLSHVVYPDFTSFLEALKRGKIAEIIDFHRNVKGKY